METVSGQRANSRRREGAKERRERCLMAEARIRLQLCRDAVRIASHRGGDGCRRARTDVFTQTAPVADPPVCRIRGTSTSDCRLLGTSSASDRARPAPVVNYTATSATTPAPTDIPLIEHVEPVIGYIAQAPPVTFSTPSQQFLAYTMTAVNTGVSLDTCFVNPPCLFPDGNRSPVAPNVFVAVFSTFQRQYRALRWHDQVSRECQFVTLCLW